jgi:hypothetical protein
MKPTAPLRNKFSGFATTPAVAYLFLVRSMRQVVLFSALLLFGCTQTKVVGPYRAGLSRTDVQSIVQIAQTIHPRYYSRMTLNAVAPDVVWVDTVSQGGSWTYDYSAVRHGGIWKRGRYTPPPPD